MKVSLVIPTRNEQGCIGKVLSEVSRKIVNEVIIVDGHSTDNTVEEVKKKLKEKDKLIVQKGIGYGAAFRQGFNSASGDVIVMMDADGSHNPKDIGKIIKKIKEGYEYVLATRYAKGGKSLDDTFIRFVGNRIFTLMTNFIHGTKVSDSLYLFTAISRVGLKKLHLDSDGFEFCTEILVKAHKAGLIFGEVPVVERARMSGKSKVNALWHGAKILRMILRNY